jgi:CO dehydrogenase flavoprotein C-terminal domain
VWDFPLVNVASAIRFSNGRIDGARLVVGAVSAKPKRLANVEAAIVGKARDEQTAEMAGAHGGGRRDHAALQRVRGAPDAEPGEGSHSRRRDGCDHVIQRHANDSPETRETPQKNYR